jgi:hypothetical protein
MVIRPDDETIRLWQGMGEDRDEAGDVGAENTQVFEFLRDEFSEDILKEIEEEGISKIEVIQLLRDIEMTEENGEVG